MEATRPYRLNRPNRRDRPKRRDRLAIWATNSIEKLYCVPSNLSMLYLNHSGEIYEGNCLFLA